MSDKHENEFEYRDGTLHGRRVYEAPRAEVFEAWIETSKVQLWWGCAMTTKVESTIDAKVGGRYQHRMTLGEHGEFAVMGVITEYDPPAKLAYKVEDEGAPEASFVTVTFTELGEGRTEVTIAHTALPEEYRDVVTGGWGAGLDKLGRLLAGEPVRAG